MVEPEVFSNIFNLFMQSYYDGETVYVHTLSYFKIILSVRSS